MTDELTIALVGNPNSGKTSAFNALTGGKQYVGNWPGVTVERKSGQLKKHPQVTIQDLPGIYSLSPYTPEERVARDYLLDASADVIINIIDSTNLERNLYLTTQLMALGIPIVLALNMMDILTKSGKRLDSRKLSLLLDMPVVEISALKKQGLDQLVSTALATSKGKQAPAVYDKRLEVALYEIEELLGVDRFIASKLFESDSQILASQTLTAKQAKELQEIITISEKVFGDDAESILVNARYSYVQTVTQQVLESGDKVERSLSDRIDQIVTQKWLAFPIFAMAMWSVYYLAIQTVGTMGTDWVNDVLFGDLIPQYSDQLLSYLKVADWMRGLIIDGIIAGCGAVLGFVPQIFVLFLCLGVLEDIGYMARIAFVMDRLFRRFGLSGKSFIPMLISTGCGVPGVMSSRTIESLSERRLTIMTTTFMPCSAKLAVIALISGVFFPYSSWVAPSSYGLGMLAIILSGIALRKTQQFQGDTSPFIMELPNYHLPSFGNVLRYAFNRSANFVKRAGTIIFALNVIIYLCANYNLQAQMVATDQSILADAGKFFAPLFEPLGWGNWRATVATVTGLVAKETVVGTFGVLYHTQEGAWEGLRADFSSLAAYSFLAFNLLCAPCFAAMSAIYREMASLTWTVKAIGYQCGLAYVVSFIIYQSGHLRVDLASLCAILLFIGMLYAIVRPARKEKSLCPPLSVQSLS